MTFAEVTDLLEREAPKALTSVAIAALLDRGVSSTNSVCCKAFFYGKIDRIAHPQHKRRFLYRANQTHDEQAARTPTFR